jgi:ABC-type transport system involved in multi-copper enzyme maturation permease subunit
MMKRNLKTIPEYPSSIELAKGWIGSPLPSLMRTVWLQAVRRNEFWVVTIMLGLYLLGGIVTRIVGVESEHSARFLSGLGFQLGSILSGLLIIIIGGRQIPVELEQRTIYPVLAKPVRRAQFITGKILPVWMTGSLALVLFTLATLIISPGMEYQLNAVLGQALILELSALLMLTCLVMAFSLIFPQALGMLMSAVTWFAGGTLANMIIQAGHQSNIIHGFAGLIPDFNHLHQFQRYVDGGGMLTGITFAGLLGYGLIWTGLFYLLAVRRFHRMPL